MDSEAASSTMNTFSFAYLKNTIKDYLLSSASLPVNLGATAIETVNQYKAFHTRKGIFDTLIKGGARNFKANAAKAEDAFTKVVGNTVEKVWGHVKSNWKYGSMEKIAEALKTGEFVTKPGASSHKL